MLPGSLAQRMSALLLALFLCECATHPSPYFAAEIRSVKVKEWNQFWVQTKGSVSVSAPEQEAAVLRGVNGFVVAQVVIDSNGRIVESKILESEPAGFFTPAAEELYRQVRYKPAPGNEARVPIRVVKSTYFGNSKQGSEEFHRSMQEKDW